MCGVHARRLYWFNAFLRWTEEIIDVGELEDARELRLGHLEEYHVLPSDLNRPLSAFTTYKVSR